MAEATRHPPLIGRGIHVGAQAQAKVAVKLRVKVAVKLRVKVAVKVKVVASKMCAAPSARAVQNPGRVSVRGKVEESVEVAVVKAIRAVRAIRVAEAARVALLGDAVVNQEAVEAEEADRQGRPCRPSSIRGTSARERIVYREVGMYGE